MISIIIPFYNEAESLSILMKQLLAVCGKLKEAWEIILVDDGSTDAPHQNFQFPISNFQKNITLIKHRKRLGKGKALLTGFNASKGEAIIFMDADLQDDPVEVPRFLSMMQKGYDLVNGWRAVRNDPLMKTLPSSIFNTFVLKFFFRSKFHDINCGYKAIKRKVLEEIPLYGDNYRFLPIMAEQAGFKTSEMVVKHHSRKYGKSKYGFFRLMFGFLDTVTTYFIYRFSEKPLHFFGPIGGGILGMGLLISMYLTIERFFFNMLLYRRPAFLFSILFIIVGLQIVMTGIIAELIVYLGKKNNKPQ